MPKGPNGEERKGDANQVAVQVGRIATRQEPDTGKPKPRVTIGKPSE